MKQHDEDAIKVFIRLMQQIGNTALATAEAKPPGTNSDYSRGKGHAWLQSAEELRSFFNIDMENYGEPK